MRSIGRNPQLDGLRAVAIVLVLVSHTLRFGDGRANAIREIVGEIGVSIFFVLSGFLITTLLVAERARNGKIDLRAFYLRRVRRIFPAYYVYLGVIGALSAAGFIAVGWKELLADALYLRDYDVHSFTWLEHTWSLAVETQFYFLWPALLLFFGNARARTIAVACIALAPLVRIGTYFLIPSQRDLMSIAFHTRVDMLMFGCATALLIQNGIPAWFQTAVDRVKSAYALTILAFCAAATGVLHGWFQYVIGMSVEGCAIALLLVGVLEQPGTPFARLLRSGPMTWIGRISYSLYLWQQPFLFPIGNSIVNHFPVGLVATFGAASASYYVVERTFFRAKPVSRLLPGTAEAS